MSLADLTVTAVSQAIEEFDRIGRDAFLKKYRFGKARDYLLQQGGRSYDSKAIAGAAHGYLPGRTALSASDFSDGDATVRRTLEALGFTVVRDQIEKLPSPGDALTNKEIGHRFAVGNMGGMRRSTKLNLLVLISDPFKGLYQDRWNGEVLHYTGMGQTGDQSLTHAQNRTLAESGTTGIPVHLFEALEPMKYTYAGAVELADAPYQEEQFDDKGELRKVWMFPLTLKGRAAKPKLTDEQARAIEENQAQIARRLSTEQLRTRAMKAKKQASVRTAQTAAYMRDAAVAEYTTRLANGQCDLCEKPAPFLNKRHEAYLECHHIVWLAQGGDDRTQSPFAQTAIARCTY
jgi:5-methylcytosine-specific restriction enzyme A